MLKITTFQNPYSAEDAENILINCDSTIKVVRMEEVYYPYKQLAYSLTLPGKLAKLDKEITCILDLIYGRPAVAQGLPTFVEKEVDESLIMDIVIPEEDLYKVSYDFVFKLFLNKSKILKAPTITVMSESIFYKLFYVVQCKDAEDKDYFVLVDSIDGNITILDWKPETPEEPKALKEEISEQK